MSKQYKSMNELITVSEAAEILKCHAQTVRAYAKKGVLKPIRYLKKRGSPVFFDKAEVKKLRQGGL